MDDKVQNLVLMAFLEPNFKGIKDQSCLMAFSKEAANNDHLGFFVPTFECLWTLMEMDFQFLNLITNWHFSI